MQGTTDTGTTVATVAPLANTPAKATVRTRRAANAAHKGMVATLKAGKAPAKRNNTGTTGTTHKPGSYAVQPLVVNAKRVQAALAQYKGGAKPARAASVLGCTTGQYAMLLMLGGTTPLGGTVPNHAYGSKAQGAPGTPAALATYVARGRAAGLSWGNLAARTRTTEPCVRAAYTAATGQHHSTSGVGAWAQRNAR